MDIATLIAAIIVPPATMGLFFLAINANLNGRIADWNNRMNDVNSKINDVQSQMQREHDALSKKVDKLDEKFDRLLFHLTTSEKVKPMHQAVSGGKGNS